MRKIKIATASSCTARVWKNTEVSYEELCKKLTTTIYTDETVAQYKQMKKADRDAVKDKGGFVPAVLKDNRRLIKNVISISCNKLDKDSSSVEFLDYLRENHPYDCVVYTTHSSTPEAPRYRIMTFYTRDVTPEEDNAIGRYLAEEVYGGINDIDPVSFRANQLMYYPTTPKDGEFVGLHLEGPTLDPDVFLAAHPDWKDVTNLPRGEKEKRKQLSGVMRAADPLTKDGIIGTFNRCYSISEAIDVFLSDVYAPTDDRCRYHYIPSDSMAGALVYDDKKFYSFHSSDPAFGRCLNAFDLVRIHKFGHMDDDAPDNTPVTRLPSDYCMRELISKDQKVMLAVLDEKAKKAQEDFEVVDDDSWKLRLTRDFNGDVQNTLPNATLILRNDPNLKNIRYNVFSDTLEITGKVPWEHPHQYWRDADDAHLLGYLTEHYCEFSSRRYENALRRVSDERSFHPVREYFDSLPPWDGTPRLETVFIDYLGAKDNPYVRTVTRNMLCGAVRRIKEPGCKFDWMVVFNGDQGIGKSTLISKLAVKWFCDSIRMTDMQDKTAAEKIQGIWIIEIGELAGMRKADDDCIKGFISRQDDRYRGAFDRRAASHLRQCVFFGTTNAQCGYLRDSTGGRRFWPIKIVGTGKYRPWELEDETVKQIWAEALLCEPTIKNLDIPPELEEAAKEEQREAMESSDLDGLVEEYLNTLLPKNWSHMDLESRRCFLRNSAEWRFENGDSCEAQEECPQKLQGKCNALTPCQGQSCVGTEVRTRVCRSEIWCECFGKAQEDLKNTNSREITSIMTRIGGWKQMPEKRHFPPYGSQYYYVRTDSMDNGNSVGDKPRSE